MKCKHCGYDKEKTIEEATKFMYWLFIIMAILVVACF